MDTVCPVAIGTVLSGLQSRQDNWYCARVQFQLPPRIWLPQDIVQISLTRVVAESTLSVTLARLISREYSTEFPGENVYHRTQYQLSWRDWLPEDIVPIEWSRMVAWGYWTISLVRMVAIGYRANCPVAIRC